MKTDAPTWTRICGMNEGDGAGNKQRPIDD